MTVIFVVALCFCLTGDTRDGRLSPPTQCPFIEKNINKNKHDASRNPSTISCNYRATNKALPAYLSTPCLSRPVCLYIRAAEFTERASTYTSPCSVFLFLLFSRRCSPGFCFTLRSPLLRHRACPRSPGLYYNR